MSKIEKLLLEKDFKPNLKGFDYIVEAIELIQQDKTYSRAITTRLYPTIAKKYNDKALGVERAIRHSIQRAKIGNTNAEFLARTIIELKGDI
jgi:two-component system response regulator (stage 0 sporulation protein A)